MNEWVAVAGTLGGVAITSIAGLVSVRQAAKLRRKEAQEQWVLEGQGKLREGRREAFVEFLVAYQALASRAMERAGLDPGADKSGRPETTDSVGRGTFRYGDEERDLFSRAYQTLLITAEEDATLEAAKAAGAALWEMVDAATVGDNEVFRAAELGTRASRRLLRECMRRELNVGMNSSD